MLNKLIGIVPNASEHGPLIDNMLEFCHWFMLLLFAGWSLFFLFTIFRFHKSRHPKANYFGVQSKASSHIEFMVVLIEAVLLLGFALPLWGRRVVEFPDRSEAQVVRVVGQQFLWNFWYPGPDGKFGRGNQSFISASNPLGRDPDDPDGKDDILTKNELTLLNDKPVILEITSMDVIHSVSLPNMRAGQDAIPGTRVPMWFKPVRKGSYEMVCAQLCGGGHALMKATVSIASQQEYDDFIKEQMQLKQAPAPAPTPVPAAK
jgi:cytochrome c oxidase subunit 2